MKVKRGRLEFNNVLGYKVKCGAEEWAKHIAIIKATTVKNDVCVTGPVIVQGNLHQKVDEVEEVTFYVPIHREVQIKEDEQAFFFKKKLYIEDTLSVRHTELEDDIRATEVFLEAVAIQQNETLKRPFYYIYLPVFQEYVIEIWAEIEKE
ncbi:MAG: hypothetical protein E7263_07140 [Lachnospiraceae bacterium]|nr:hypothetical protein [Lachnospiraceae bacterium]